MSNNKVQLMKKLCISILLVTGLGLLPTCKTNKANNSNLDESVASAYAMQIRVFKKIIGRNPSVQELKPMKDMTLAQSVDHVLTSEAFIKEGYLKLHSDRLLLTRDGTEQWIQGSTNDYCSLRWELEAAALQDRAGAGYWTLVRNQQKWLPISAFVSNPADPFPELKQTLQYAYRVPELNLTMIDGRTPVRKLVDPETCSYEDVAPDAIVTSGGTPLFVSVELPPDYAGIHAHPFYLNRHLVTPANQHLHRGRTVLFSWFCTDVSPDAANNQGGLPVPIQDHDSYFITGEPHAMQSQNCYQCHTKIQPMGNFFGRTNLGKMYMNSPFSTFYEPSPIGGQSVITGKLGGYREGDRFFPIQGTNEGMQGLANLLSQHPDVRACVVDSVWSQLVGRTYPLTILERNAAVAAFAGDKPSIADLIRHLTVGNERGQVYFARGETPLSALKVDDAPDCNSITQGFTSDNAAAITKDKCGNSCHVRPFADANGNISETVYFSGSPGTPDKVGRLWHSLHCQVKTGLMPKSGGLSAIDKHKLVCFFQKTMKEKAGRNELPKSYVDLPCETISQLQP